MSWYEDEPRDECSVCGIGEGDGREPGDCDCERDRAAERAGAPTGLTQAEYIRLAVECLHEAIPDDNEANAYKRWALVVERIEAVLVEAEEQGLIDGEWREPGYEVVL